MTEQCITFEQWLVEVLPDEPVPGVVAYSFNLAECGDWIVEVIGASTYHGDDPEWACPPEAWTCRPSQYIIPRDIAPQWPLALEYVVRRVSTFVRESSVKCADVLRQSKSVCVGFIDGDLTRVWPEGDA
jgi:hypothetical protein